MTPFAAFVDEARDLLGSVGRILLRAGLPLLGIAALGQLGGFWLARLAVVASRTDAVVGILVFALVPATGFAAVYLMLSYLGRRGGDTPRRATLATLGAALLVYLVIYEQSGMLREERRAYLWDTFSEAIWADPETAGNRVPNFVSTTVLVIVAVAFLLRVVGGRLVQRLEASERRSRPARVGTAVLRPLLGYAEILWIVLAVISLLTLWDQVTQWWSSRVVVHAVGNWWLDLGIPSVMPVVGFVSTAVGEILGAVVAGIVVPVIWLVLASLIYGVRFGDLSSVPAYLARVTAQVGQKIPVGARRRSGTGPGEETVARIERSWLRLTEPEGRWDAMGGALGLVLARGWIAIPTYCLVFLLLSLVDRVIWWVAGLSLSRLLVIDWFVVGNAIYGLTAVLLTTLAVSVAAAGADVALRRAGLASPLREDLAPRAGVSTAAPTTATSSVPMAPQPTGNSQ